MEMSADIDRTLGRIEGMQEAILAEIGQFKTAFNLHVKEDNVALVEIRRLIETLVKEVKKENEEKFMKLEEKLAELRKDRDVVKGAGWILLGFIAFVGTVLGPILVEMTRRIWK